MSKEMYISMYVCTKMFIAVLLIIAKVEITQMFTNGTTDKQIVVYSHYEILRSKENDQTKHVTRSMNYPNVTLKERSQT